MTLRLRREILAELTPGELETVVGATMAGFGCVPTGPTYVPCMVVLAVVRATVDAATRLTTVPETQAGC